MRAARRQGGRRHPDAVWTRGCSQSNTGAPMNQVQAIGPAPRQLLRLPATLCSAGGGVIAPTNTRRQNARTSPAPKRAQSHVDDRRLPSTFWEDAAVLSASWSQVRQQRPIMGWTATDTWSQPVPGPVPAPPFILRKFLSS